VVTSMDLSFCAWLVGWLEDRYRVGVDVVGFM
jgi:hypothetical protein